ncbi:unnamed protein product [Nippostrongylus brasiliensis]|uniref:Uncharacterized protein n=1 Tax=Nippostrongylus brasiliensis TaxID=27835 RepID=A0A0N4XJH4_NIPBR|nr:unnamed protein product [Nippostrongylus brasiliensis]
MRDMAATTNSLISGALNSVNAGHWRGAPLRSTYPPMGTPPRTAIANSPSHKNHKIIGNHTIDGHITRSENWDRSVE